VGFSVDVLSEAARASDIELDWQFHPEGPQRAFAKKAVDLWPLWASAAATKSKLYASKPWLENQYAVAWRGDGTGSHLARPDFRGKIVATANLPFVKRLAADFLPPFREDLAPNRTIALQHLCSGKADAIFLEVRLLEAMLLRRPPGCEAVDLRVEVAGGVSVQMSTASTWEFRSETDGLRRQIDLMFQDGRFARFLDSWFVFSNVEAHALADLHEQRRKNLYTIVALGVVILFLGLLLWMYRHARIAVREAERANRAKSEFLANVSHDVRTPMNGVLAIADLMLRTPLTAEQRDYTVTIRDSAGLQLAILNDLLDSAKIDSGKLVLEQVVFSPAALLEQVRLAFSAMASERGLRLALSCVAVPKAVTGDPLRLRQAVSNLVSNAIKFTPDGQVTIEARGAMDGDGAKLTFSVTDTGIGIDTRQQSQIFEKFTQADGSTTRRFGGTGLGLSICRSLVELMGGQLLVDSAPGVGSRFWFTVTLPVAAEEREVADLECDEKNLHAELPVLIAEDNPVNRKVAVALLKSFGLQVDVVGTGAEALERCLTRSYAAVLMDCQMPEMDGYEATRRIRQAGRTNLPIIALTAGASATERQLALDTGMDAFIAKPVRREELARALEGFLNCQSGRR
jgi:signal transduction histidine kinase/ActR/RegA family two-component response regulator